jgi:ATP-dependent RNA helicase DDX35
MGCSAQILSIAAMTTVPNLFIEHSGNKKPVASAKRLFTVEEGDHLTLLNIYLAFTSNTVGKKSVQWCRDHYLNYKALTKAVSVRNQLFRYMERLYPNIVNESSELATAQTIQRCLTTGYFSHAARMQPDGTYRTVNGDVVLWAHPSSIMFNRKADWVIFGEIQDTREKTFIKDVSYPSPRLPGFYTLIMAALTDGDSQITTVQKNWLLEFAPEFYRVK